MGKPFAIIDYYQFPHGRLFRTMGIPIVAGHGFEPTTSVASANEPPGGPQTIGQSGSAPSDFVSPIVSLRRPPCLRRDVGSLEAVAGDDWDAHRFEIVAHEELVVVDDCKGLPIVGGRSSR